jgi:hypothetical protein
MEVSDFYNITEAYYNVYQNLDEAEGSYGQTPKAHQSWTNRLRRIEATPAKNKMFRGKGGKTKVEWETRDHTTRSNAHADYGHSGKHSDTPSGATDRVRMTPKNRAYARQEHEFDAAGLDAYGEPTKPGGMPKPRKLARQRATGVSAESYDVFDESTAMSRRGISPEREAKIRLDISKSSLPQRGKPHPETSTNRAERLEAEGKMTYGGGVNREARTNLARAKRRDQQTTMDTPGFTSSKNMDPETPAGKLQTARRLIRHSDPYPGSQRQGIHGYPEHPLTRKESYDLIISHLLDEGYANTSDQARIILKNMSEDWMHNILESAKQGLFDAPPTTHRRVASGNPLALMSPGMRADERSRQHQQNLPKGDRRIQRQKVKADVIAGAFRSARNPR